jgi:hypothetical protein
MLNINEEELKAGIIAQAADQLVRNDEDLSGMVAKEVAKRINAIFVDRVEAQIQAAIDAAVNNAFDEEYQRVTQWGQPDGPSTTVRKQLEKIVNGYWSAKVDAKTGKPSTSDYSSVTRAEYLMTTICAEDFSAAMKQSALNVTGALKDGLRNQIGQQMDVILNELFRVKSLQDQGKVEKPY